MTILLKLQTILLCWNSTLTTDNNEILFFISYNDVCDYTNYFKEFESYTTNKNIRHYTLFDIYLTITKNLYITKISGDYKLYFETINSDRFILTKIKDIDKYFFKCIKYSHLYTLNQKYVCDQNKIFNIYNFNSYFMYYNSKKEIEIHNDHNLLNKLNIWKNVLIYSNNNIIFEDDYNKLLLCIDKIKKNGRRHYTNNDNDINNKDKYGLCVLEQKNENYIIKILMSEEDIMKFNKTLQIGEEAAKKLENFHEKIKTEKKLLLEFYNSRK